MWRRLLALELQEEEEEEEEAAAEAGMEDDAEEDVAVAMTAAARPGSRGRRRVVRRTDGGPMHSTMAGYVFRGDDATYRKNFRMSRRQLRACSEAFAERGFLRTNQTSNPESRFPAVFKFATCMYVVAHGGNGSSPWKPAADTAGLGESTVKGWMQESSCREESKCRQDQANYMRPQQ